MRKDLNRSRNYFFFRLQKVYLENNAQATKANNKRKNNNITFFTECIHSWFTSRSKAGQEFYPFFLDKKNFNFALNNARFNINEKFQFQHEN